MFKPMVHVINARNFPFRPPFHKGGIWAQILILEIFQDIPVYPVKCLPSERRSPFHNSGVSLTGAAKIFARLDIDKKFWLLSILILQIRISRCSGNHFHHLGIGGFRVVHTPPINIIARLLKTRCFRS